ncbi:hypothetical protein QM333_34780, partial [Pseudomonas aeruginosa]
SDNALREYGEAVLGDAAPDLVLVFPGGRLTRRDGWFAAQGADSGR